MKKPSTPLREWRVIVLAITYSHKACRPTTIGVAAFHFRVRDGTGWGRGAMVTRRPPRNGCGAGFLMITRARGETGAGSLTFACRQNRRGQWSRQKPREKKKKQIDRTISTAQLNALPHLHRQPINVVVYHGPIGKIHLGRSLALRCFQRLSLPRIAAQRCP